MEIQSNHFYLGSLLAQYVFEENEHEQLQSDQNAFLTFQTIDQNHHISLLKSENILTYIVTKNPNTFDKCYARQKKKSKSIYYQTVKLHGRICHCYDEIWWFLLRTNYIKVKASIPKIQQEQDSLQLIKLDIYLKKNALNDNFDISKYNQRAYLDNTIKLNVQDIQEDNAIDFIYYARLSLLLLFDLISINRSIPAIVKSDKYVKNFFSQVEKIHNLTYWQSIKIELTFKDTPRLLVNDKEYFKKSLINSSYTNKLYQQKDLRQNFITIQNDSYYLGYDKTFIPKIQETPIYQSIYFLKYLNQLIIQFQINLFKLTQQQSPQQAELFRKLCLEYLFRQVNANENINMIQQISSDEKLNQFRSKMTNIETICFKKFKSIINTQQQESNYFDIINPFIHLVISSYQYRTKRQEFESQICTANLALVGEIQNKLKELEDDRKNEISKAIEFCIGKTTLNQDIAQQQINSFLDSDDQQFFQHPKPKYMITELKPHQKEALTWMLYREGLLINLKDSNQKQQECKQLSPLWEEITLQSGKKIYLNTFTGKVTEEFQTSNNTKGGILADEMGLGKTIMTIALILQTKKIGKTTLIVVPKSVLLQWDKEIKTHTQSGVLSILIYYKLSNKQKEVNFANYDIILTTYTVLGQNYQNWLKEQNQEDNEIRVRSRQRKEKNQQSYEENSYNNQQHYNNLEYIPDQINSVFELKDEQQQQFNFKSEFELLEQDEVKQKKKVTYGLNLFDYYYHRVILDEAHNIKTRNTLQTRGAMSLQSECRWCLTGTPIQNKHDDLFSLLSFLRLETFGEYYWWNAYINKEENENEQQKVLREIIKPVILRRTKAQLNKHEVKIEEEIHWVELEKMERVLYNYFLYGTQELFQGYLKGEKTRSFVHIFQIINKLRMTCDHPYLALKGINLDTVDNIKKEVENYFKKQENGEKASDIKLKQQAIEMIKAGEITDCTQCNQEGIIIFGVSICGHIFCYNCFKDNIDSFGDCPGCARSLTLKDIIKVSNDEEEYQQFKQHKWVSSSKLKAVVDEAKKVQERKEKCLIFTQWIEMINLLEEQFQEKGIWCSVITGANSIEQRNKIISAFDSHSAQTALILSLRATSTGLNLTMANNVFLVDPWWNPAIEEQAIGRVDRIGQKKQVHVIRFLCKDTIEQQINLLHKKKKKMIMKVISNEQKKLHDIDDFKFLIFDQNT